MSREHTRPTIAGERRAGLRGVVAVAATYTFFLLWAQYGFLDLLQARLGDAGRVRLAMAAMGICGLAASLAAAGVLGGRRGGPGAEGRWRRASTTRRARLSRRPATRLLTAGFLACAVAATASLAAHGTAALVAAAAAIGVATALVTVPLAADLRRLVDGRRFGLSVGLGTGIAYLVCNLPPLFEGTPAVRALFVAVVCLAAAWVVAPAGSSATPGAGGEAAAERAASPTGTVPTGTVPTGTVLTADFPTGTVPTSTVPAAAPLLPRRAYRGAGFAAVVAALLALVWLDSAAFAVIQETAALKGQSWAGAAHTLTQGTVHLLAAVAAGLAIDAGGLLLLPPAAFLLFLVALPQLSGSGASPLAAGALLAAPLYAAGISLYSVALVAYPASRGDEPGLVPRRWRAAVLFGVAGWLGSALGVGMAQDLHRIPLAFLVAAGAVLLAALVLARGGGGRSRPARQRRACRRWNRPRDGGGREPVLGIAPSVVDDRSTSEAANGSTKGTARERREASGARGATARWFATATPRATGPRAALRLVGVPLLFAMAGVVWAVATAPPETDPAATTSAPPHGTPRAAAAAVARGRRIYVGEGCVHCHSQYVRPLAADVEPWGPFPAARPRPAAAAGRQPAAGAGPRERRQPPQRAVATAPPGGPARAGAGLADAVVRPPLRRRRPARRGPGGLSRQPRRGHRRGALAHHLGVAGPPAAGRLGAARQSRLRPLLRRLPRRRRPRRRTAGAGGAAAGDGPGQGRLLARHVGRGRTWRGRCRRRGRS